jgi:hypothetical protein
MTLPKNSAQRVQSRSTTPALLTPPYPTYPIQANPVFNSPQSSTHSEPSSASFVAMLHAYRATGGTAHGEKLAHVLQHHGLHELMSLSRLISKGKVFSFVWRKNYWVPMFQFERNTLIPLPGLQPVIAELGKMQDDWSRSVWFTQPHAQLGYQKPVDLIGTHPATVLHACRISPHVAHT